MEPAPKLPPKPIREQAKVLYAYDAQNDDELTIKEGDIINVISKEIEDQGWFKGELNGKIGVFPDNFVELIRCFDDEKPIPPRPKGAPPPSSATSSSSSTPKILTKAHSITDGNVSSSTSTNKSDNSSNSILRTSGIFGGLQKKVAKTTGSVLVSSSSAKVTAKTPVLSHSTSVDSDHSESNNNNSNASNNNNNNNDSNTFSGIESSIKLNHPTANRPKGPSNRRPPSYIASPSSSATHGKDGTDGESIENGDTSSNGITSNSNGSSHHTGLAKGPAVSGTTITPGTIEPVSRTSNSVTSPGNKGNKEDPPWMVELRKTQELKRTKTLDSSPIASERSITSNVDSESTNCPPPRASNRASGDFSSRLSSFATPSTGATSNTSHNSNNNASSGHSTAASIESTPSIGSSILKPTKPAKPTTTNASSPTSGSNVPFGSRETSATNTNSNFNSSHNSKLTTSGSNNSTSEINNSPIVIELQRELKQIKETYVTKIDDLAKQVSNSLLIYILFWHLNCKLDSECNSNNKNSRQLLLLTFSLTMSHLKYFCFTVNRLDLTCCCCYFMTDDFLTQIVLELTRLEPVVVILEDAFFTIPSKKVLLFLLFFNFSNNLIVTFFSFYFP